MLARFTKMPFALSLSVLSLFVANNSHAFAGSIPYPNAGTLNPETYSFKADHTGDVIAYFAGSTAGYDNQLGMLVNGVQSSAGFGLDNHSSPLGLALDLGHVTKGDTLVFDLRVNSLGGLIAYSDPALNSAYDNGGTGLNHVYSTAYTGSLGHGIPNGTFVSFEDLRGGGDLNYNDENFVFTNVASVPNAHAVPEPSSIALCSLGGLALIANAIRKRRHNVARGSIGI